MKYKNLFLLAVLPVLVTLWPALSGTLLLEPDAPGHHGAHEVVLLPLPLGGEGQGALVLPAVVGVVLEGVVAGPGLPNVAAVWL